MVPIFLNLENRVCVVIGGGGVGRRKALGLLEGGARVRLVCLEQQPAACRHERLEWFVSPYGPEHLADAALVIAAATPELNRQVVADCRARGLWVNAASNPVAGDFFLPAVLRRGELTVAVSTGGLAPLAARAVRDQLASRFDDAFECWLSLLAELRPVVYASIADPEARNAAFERLASASWAERLRHESPDEVGAAMRAEISRLSGLRSGEPAPAARPTVEG